MNNNRYIIDCDFHTHTGFSDDCDVSVEEMLKSAADQGIRTLAVTDHYDPGYPDIRNSYTSIFTLSILPLLHPEDKWNDIAFGTEPEIRLRIDLLIVRIKTVPAFNSLTPSAVP